MGERPVVSSVVGSVARSVVVVAYDRAELLDLACITTTLDAANHLGPLVATDDDPFRGYEVAVATPGGHPVVCNLGMALQGHVCLERLTGPIDTLVVVGGMGSHDAAQDTRIVGHVRRLARDARRVASVCTGAMVLAATGLLDGRRATTHWRWAPRLAADHPGVTVDPAPIFIRDGHVATSAGVTSALDLTLAFVEEDHGAELARQVARQLVTYLQRPGNQAQMSVHVAAPPPDHDLVRRVMAHVASHLDGDLSTAALAALAGVSERHLARLFAEHCARTPARFVRESRADAAAQLLVSTSLPLAAVALRCGFGSAETLRQAFVQRYGVPPARYRATQSRAAAG
jgi:transcriptional regulator GlxA family with amidase domain